jgi:hypothetical protein
MRYERHPDGSLTPLAQQSIDTGMGLERLLMVSQGVASVYETEIFAPWLDALRSVCPDPDPGLGCRSRRVIIDHLRSAAIVIGDGVFPSSTGRGYVLRRLLRRALTELWHGNPDSPLTLAGLPPGVLGATAEQFGQPAAPAQVLAIMQAEERRFRQLLTRGRSLLRRLFPSGQLDPDVRACADAEHWRPARGRHPLPRPQHHRSAALVAGCHPRENIGDQFARQPVGVVQIPVVRIGQLPGREQAAQQRPATR